MIVCPLFSGSSGNATYVASGFSRILIDGGVSCRRLCCALRGIGVNPSSLTAILATHAHSDHVMGLGAMCRQYNLPIYGSVGFWDEALKKDKFGMVAGNCIKVFQSSDNGSLDLGGLNARYFPTPHDARDPVGYVLSDGKASFGLATDLGCATPLVRSRLNGCDVVLLEANYDYDMLINGPYPYPLKQRILSDHGHLCNDAAGEFAVELVRSGVKTLFLGHLSAHNNTQLLAYTAVASALKNAGVALEEDCRVYMTRREEPSRFLEF